MDSSRSPTTQTVVSFAELERISSARSVPAAATSNAATRAAEERAASLEKQVQSLTTRLQAAESAADKDKENLGPTATGIPVTSVSYALKATQRGR